mgnify:CR=1 FL=1|jgi:hypothetical protein
MQPSPPKHEGSKLAAATGEKVVFDSKKARDTMMLEARRTSTMLGDTSMAQLAMLASSFNSERLATMSGFEESFDQP